MKFFENRRNAIFILLIAILIFCIGTSSFLFTVYRDVASKYKENESVLAEAQTHQQELQSQLDAANAEKKRLEEENAGLKQQIIELAAKKKQEQLQAAANAQQSSAQPTVPQPAPQPIALDRIMPTVSGPKTCYLTFDDGPSDNTLKILDTLAKYKAKATFFVTGNSGKTEYIKNIHAAGQAIGLHTATHSYSYIYTSVDNYLADLNSISSTVEQLTGIKSMVVRFPGGSSNRVSRDYSRGYKIMTDLSQRLPGMGYAYFDWNVDSNDAGGSKTEYDIAYNVLVGASNKRNICVLMHDSAAKTATANALPTIIENLQRMGFSFDVLTTAVSGFHHGISN